MSQPPSTAGRDLVLELGIILVIIGFLPIVQRPSIKVRGTREEGGEVLLLRKLEKRFGFSLFGTVMQMGAAACLAASLRRRGWAGRILIGAGLALSLLMAVSGWRGAEQDLALLRSTPGASTDLHGLH